jgi:hypothetical protein
MIELLERYGAIAHPVSAGLGGDVEKAKRLIADDAAGKFPSGFIGPQETLGELLLWSSGAGHPEVVRLAPLARPTRYALPRHALQGFSWAAHSFGELQYRPPFPRQIRQHFQPRVDRSSNGFHIKSAEPAGERRRRRHHLHQRVRSICNAYLTPNTPYANSGRTGTIIARFQF